MDATSGGGGGADNGDMLPGCKARWSAGGTGADKMMVSISGETVSARSAKPSAALACNLWAAVRSKNTADIFLQVGLSSTSAFGSLSAIVPKI